MAMEQHCTPTLLQNVHCYENDMEICQHTTIPTDDNLSSGFDCSICLDSVQDPVVTLCGHLYCWPCIYKWICQQSDSPYVTESRTPQCPVCKADVSERTLIPLYGPGRGTKPTNLDSVIPSRPTAVHHMVAASTSATNQLQAQQGGYYGYMSGSDISLGGGVTVHPMISMFGEMICSRLSGNTQQTSSYVNPSSYSVATAGSARGRRRVMQADRSLSRLNFFLCCCLVMCLLLF